MRNAIQVGFAVKFYTEEGTDLTGNNTPVFFLSFDISDDFDFHPLLVKQ